MAASPGSGLDRVPPGEPPTYVDAGKEARAAAGIPIVAAFDGYRAYAILAIVVWHVLVASAAVPLTGGSAADELIRGSLPRMVDVLFIVSGFILFIPTAAEDGRFGSIAAYALRRGARILPAYWVTLALSLVALALLGSQVAYPAAVGIGAHVAGVHGPAGLLGFEVGLPTGTPLALMGQVWTLSVELGFYLVLPIVAVAYFRHPWLGLAIAAAIEVAWIEAFQHLDWVNTLLGLDPSGNTLIRLHASAGAQLPSWAFSFAAGMTGAWLYVRLRSSGARESLERHAGWVALLAALALPLFAYLMGKGSAFTPQSPAVTLGYSAALAIAMVAAALASPRVQWIFGNPTARRLGDISYGIFLVHVPIIWFATSQLHLRADGTAADVLAWAAVVIPASVAYGYLSARFVELPIRRWAHRFGRRRQAGSPAPAPAASGSTRV